MNFRLICRFLFFYYVFSFSCLSNANPVSNNQASADAASSSLSDKKKVVSNPAASTGVDISSSKEKKVVSVNRTSYEYGFHYKTLSSPVSTKHDLIEFFSVLCGHCQEEQSSRIKDTINGAGLYTVLRDKYKIDFVQFHVSFLGRKKFANNLQREYAKAYYLGNDVVTKYLDEVISRMTDVLALHKLEYDQKKNDEFFKKIFKDIGVSESDYNALKYDFNAHKAYEEMLTVISDLGQNISSVPSYLVKGKYFINVHNLVYKNSEDAKNKKRISGEFNYSEEVYSIVNYLMKLDSKKKI